MLDFRAAAMAVLAICAAAMGTPAAAVVLAENHFDTGAEGWLNGDFTVRDRTFPVGFDSAGFITIDDEHGLFTAFVAPVGYLGDKRAANGGDLSFDLGADLNEGDVRTAVVTLKGAGKLIYGGIFTTPPSTTGFTHYQIALRASDFFLGDPGDLTRGLAIDEAQFLTVLRNLEQVAILGDFHSGADFARLDNVVLTAGPLSGASVPEPGAWALMLAGLGLAGAALRRRARLA